MKMIPRSLRNRQQGIKGKTQMRLLSDGSEGRKAGKPGLRSYQQNNEEILLKRLQLHGGVRMRRR